MEIFTVVYRILSILFLVGCTAFLYNILLHQYSMKTDIIEVKLELIDIQTKITDHIGNAKIHTPKTVKDASYVSIPRFETSINAIEEELDLIKISPSVEGILEN